MEIEERCIQNEKRLSKLENRVTKLETNDAKFETRFERKHDEIAMLMNTIEDERKEIAEMNANLKTVMAMLEENNKDTAFNTKEINVLKSNVTSMQSTISTLKWCIGVVIALIPIAVTIMFEIIH